MREFVIFIAITIGLMVLGWYTQHGYAMWERFEGGDGEMDAADVAFKSRLALLEDSRTQDANATVVAGNSVEGGQGSVSDVYSFVANYCS